MSSYFLGWFAVGVSVTLAVMILLHLYRTGVTLKSDVCKRCKYILVASTPCCPECGAELSVSTILSKGELLRSTRMKLIVCWLLLMILPVRLLLYSVEPPTRVQNFAGMLICDKELMGNRRVMSSDGVIRTITSKNTIQGVDNITLAVPSDLTQDTLIDTIVQDKTKLDCLVTIQKEDGTVSTMLVMIGANQFILNVGLETEQTYNRTPTVLDYAQMAGLSTSLPTSESMRYLSYFLESTFALMKIPNPTGGTRSVHLINHSVHMPAGRRLAQVKPIWDTYFTPALFVLFVIWFVGVGMIIEWGSTRSSPNNSTITH